MRRMDKENIVGEVKKDLSNILAGDSKKLVEDAEKLGRYLAQRRGRIKEMTTSQIRNIFSEVKRMEFNKYKIELLRPKLAYTARHEEVRDLQEVLDEAIRKVENDEEKFERFRDFFEAVVAYHRRYGKE
jgi:CRISPR-associated protein Csm2